MVVMMMVMVPVARDDHHARPVGVMMMVVVMVPAADADNDLSQLDV